MTTPDPTQPQPQAEGYAEQQAELIATEWQTVEWGGVRVTAAPSTREPLLALLIRAAIANGVRTGLARAAEIVRDRIETHPDGAAYETRIDYAVQQALDAAADAIEAAAK